MIRKPAKRPLCKALAQLLVGNLTGAEQVRSKSVAFLFLLLLTLTSLNHEPFQASGKDSDLGEDFRKLFRV